jgi:hypothetical protein
MTPHQKGLITLALQHNRFNVGLQLGHSFLINAMIRSNS